MFIKNAYLCHNCHHNLVHLNHDHSQNIVYLYKRKKQKVRNCLYLLIQVENYALFKCLKFFLTPLPNLFIKAWLLPSSITWLCIRISRIGVSIWIFIALKWGNKLIYYYACAKYITDNCCTYNESPQQLTWLL